jgi:hypothetical protein
VHSPAPASAARCGRLPLRCARDATTTGGLARRSSCESHVQRGACFCCVGR